MAILNDEKSTSNTGFIKTIESSAVSMLIRNTQVDIYQYPIKSFIREVTSNAVDSKNERNNARAIISGKSEVSDFYVEKEGDLFQDSKFDSSYFDLAWLSDLDTVQLYYVNCAADNRDYFIIRDHGSGIGEDRLRGYFKLGYSTKRAEKTSIGKFGIGAKAGVAYVKAYNVGDSFRMRSNHNGKQYEFDVQSETFQNIHGKFSAEGKSNPKIIWRDVEIESNGVKTTVDEYPVYHTTTEEKNGVSIFLEVKKFHKSKFIDAVKEQLNYFQDVELHEAYVENHYNLDFNFDSTCEVPFKSEILYEDEHIIIPKESRLTRPHIVIGRVNYNCVDYDELELDHKYGAIGLKIPAHKVSVNQSRETIKWDEISGNSVKESNAAMERIAEKHILNEFSSVSGNFLDWVAKLSAFRGRGNADTVLARLAKVVDVAEVTRKALAFKLAFTDSDGITQNQRVYDHQLVTFRKTYSVEQITAYHGSDDNPHNIKLDKSPISESRINATEFFALFHNPDTQVLYSPEDVHYSSNVIKYLVHVGVFNTNSPIYRVRKSPMNDLSADDRVTCIRNGSLFTAIDAILKKAVLDGPTRVVAFSKNDLPEDWLSAAKRREAIKKEKAEKDSMTPSERRKLEKKFLVRKLYMRTFGGYEERCDLTAEEIEDEFNYPTTLVAPVNAQSTLTKLLGPDHSFKHIIIVAQPHLKMFYRATHFQDYLTGLKGNHMIKHSEEIKRSFTSHILLKYLKKVSLFKKLKFEDFKPVYDLFPAQDVEDILELTAYHETGGAIKCEIVLDDFHELASYMNTLISYQLKFATAQNAGELDAVKKELGKIIGNDFIEQISLLDLDILSKMFSLIYKYSPINHLFTAAMNGVTATFGVEYSDNTRVFPAEFLAQISTLLQLTHKHKISALEYMQDFKIEL